MLSQIAVQVSPDVMKIATKLAEKYNHDFDQVKWHDDNRKPGKPVGSAEFAFGPL